MAQEYHIKFHNRTDTPWHAGVYQKFPTIPGISIVWKSCRLPPESYNDLGFKLQYGVVLANWDEAEMIYLGQQQRNAVLGAAYQAKFYDGDIPSIDAEPTGSAKAKDEIQVQNNTTSMLNIGVTLDGDLLFMEDVQGGTISNFKVHPTYYVALYHSIKKGQMADAGVSTEPLQVQFKDGCTIAEVEAVTESGRITLNRIK